MKSNPILEELWQVKKDLEREANNDLHEFCQQLRQWAKAHTGNGEIVPGTEELRKMVEAPTAESCKSGASALNEKPSEYGKT